MARPREFDERTVLLNAMQVFLRKGFEATSLTELLQATGLSKSSLYDTFGPKRELFMAAFEMYRQERARVLRGILRSEATAYLSIRSFFYAVLEHAQSEERPFGCMSCNEAVELAPHDPEVRRLIERDFSGMEDAFAEVIKRGKSDGSISSANGVRQLARFLVVSHQGLQVMVRSRTDGDRIEDALNLILQALQSTPAFKYGNF